MKKPVISLLLAGTLLLAGCANAFEKEYSYSTAFTGNIRPAGGDATEISNYNMLKSALVDLVNSHEESGAFRFSRYNGSVADDVAAACLEVRTENPLGAYAVETLTCDTSRIVSYYTADIQITYKKSLEEIRGIVGVDSLAELEERLWEAVTGFEPELVLRVYSPQVDEDYIAALVEGFHLSDPVTVVTEPETEIDSYPAEGINRIYDLRLRYGASGSRLREMAGQVSEGVWALVGELETEQEPELRPGLALECAEKLYDSLTGENGLYPGTAYGALAEHAADSKGVALAYKALCDALGIECLVVKGNVGSMGAEEHYWNIIGLEGAYYHVDVSAFGGERADAFLLDDDSLWGTYLWDTEAVPACAGSLRYTDVVPEEPAPAGPGEGTAPPEGTPEQPGEQPAEETAPPEETDPAAEPSVPEDPVETEGPAETETPEKNEEHLEIEP